MDTICAACSKALAPDDTFVVRAGRLSHLDCKRPKILSPEERALLFRYCWTHPTADCRQCAKSYRMTELASDMFSGREHLCPGCRANLTAGIRQHFYNCTMLPAAVRQRAREARETAQRLVKRSHELGDRADVLLRELEVALRMLRETAMREPPRPSKRSANDAD